MGGQLSAESWAGESSEYRKRIHRENIFKTALDLSLQISSSPAFPKISLIRTIIPTQFNQEI
jgi:hypothetical protein